MKNFIYLVITANLFCSLGCKKDNVFTNITLEGTLYSVYSSEPITEGEIQLLYCKKGANDTLIYRSAHTDNQGEFNINFDADSDYDYFLSAEADGFYTNRGKYYPTTGTGPRFRYSTSSGVLSPTNGAVPITPIDEKDANFSQTIKLVPEGKISVKIVNLGKIYNTFVLEPPLGSNVSENLEFTGMDVDVTMEFTIYAGINIPLETYKYSSPNQQQGDALRNSYMVKAKPHDVTDVLIAY